MYRPAEFDAPDLARAAEHVRRFPMGVLVSAGGGLRATHLPFLLGETTGGEAFPATLVSHGAAANPQLQDLTDGEEVLVVLPGPEAYVSASWYRAEPDVPTWNYTAVHVHGRYRRLDRPAADALLDRTVHEFETDRGEPGWGLHRLDPALVRRLARGVIAFTVDVVRVRSAAKLSQDKLEDDVQQVRTGIRRRDGDHPLLGELERHSVRGRDPLVDPTTAGPSVTPRSGTAEPRAAGPEAPPEGGLA